MKRRFLFICILLLLAATPLYLRSLREAQYWYNIGEHGETFDDRVNAYRRAIAWDSPWNTFSTRAAVQLQHLAHTFPPEDPARLIALQHLKSGLKSSRNILQRHAELLSATEDEISQLSEKEATLPGVQKRYPPHVHYRWQIVAQLLFWSWIGSVLLTIMKGFTPQGEPVRPALKRGLLVITILYCGWLTALSLA